MSNFNCIHTVHSHKVYTYIQYICIHTVNSHKVYIYIYIYIYILVYIISKCNKLFETIFIQKLLVNFTNNYKEMARNTLN